MMCKLNTHAAVAALCLCLCMHLPQVFAEEVAVAQCFNDKTALVALAKQYLVSVLLALKTLHGKVRMVLPVALAVLAAHWDVPPPPRLASC